MRRKIIDHKKMQFEKRVGMTIRLQKNIRNKFNSHIAGSGQKQQEVVERIIAWYAENPAELTRFFQ
jgi:hypothetical protein